MNLCQQWESIIYNPVNNIWTNLGVIYFDNASPVSCLQHFLKTFLVVITWKSTALANILMYYLYDDYVSDSVKHSFKNSIFILHLTFSLKTELLKGHEIAFCLFKVLPKNIKSIYVKTVHQHQLCLNFKPLQQYVYLANLFQGLCYFSYFFRFMKWFYFCKVFVFSII